MLHQATPDNFDIARDLFDGELHLAVVAAFAGETPAELYVDDPSAPRAGLLVLRDHRFYLAGTPRDEAFPRAVADLLRHRYTPSTPGAEPFECAIAYTPSAWEDRLPRLFADIQSVRYERQYYRLRLRDRVSPPAIPEGFRLRPVDETLLAEMALGNREALVAEIHSEAPSVADFLAHKFGSCLQYGQELVGWCLSEYNHGERCELGIETLPDYQRRGLATATALATIARAQSAGIAEIGWDCWKQNTASSGLAHKLGFTLVADYPVWYCRFAPPATPASDEPRP
jgi:RimJ/RimL family protein N-acetyltransferase